MNNKEAYKFYYTTTGLTIYNFIRLNKYVTVATMVHDNKQIHLCRYRVKIVDNVSVVSRERLIKLLRSINTTVAKEYLYNLGEFFSNGP